MKIQKLLYIAQGYFLVEQGKPLLDEVFEAWKFGPVLDSLYHECKHFGHKGVDKFLSGIGGHNGRIRQAPIPEDDDIKDIVDFVWKNYGNEEPTSLSAWTHEKGGPWDEVTDGGNNILRHKDVPNEKIKEYFEKHMYDD